jgi:hypothetical protein
MNGLHKHKAISNSARRGTISPIIPLSPSHITTIQPGIFTLSRPSDMSARNARAERVPLGIRYVGRVVSSAITTVAGSIHFRKAANVGRLVSLTCCNREGSKSEGTTSLWDRVKDRYLMELEERTDFDSALQTASWEMILEQTKAHESSIARRTSLSKSVQRLEPALIRMNNFATVITVFCGADAKIAALIWGSIRIILSVG